MFWGHNSDSESRSESQKKHKNLDDAGTLHSLHYWLQGLSNTFKIIYKYFMGKKKEKLAPAFEGVCSSCLDYID